MKKLLEVKTRKNLIKSLRYVNKNNIHTNQLVRESAVLFPNKDSDPYIDLQYGKDVLDKKQKYIKENFLKSSQERINESLEKLYPEIRMNLRSVLRNNHKLDLSKMENETHSFKKRYFEYSSKLSDLNQSDYYLDEIPLSLARNREPEFMVEDYKEIFLSEKKDDLDVVKKNFEWREEFMQESPLLKGLKNTEVIITNISPEFNLYEFLLIVKRKISDARILDIEKDIYGNISAVKFGLSNSIFAQKFAKSYKGIVIKGRKLITISTENKEDFKTVNKTVVFFRIKQRTSENEFLHKFNNYVNINKVHIPKIRSNGRLPYTFELRNYLKKEGKHILKESNVRIMEFGARGWKVFEYSPELDINNFSFDDFLEKEDQFFDQEIERFKYNVTNNFKNYFKFIEKELNKKTYFTVEDPSNRFAVENNFGAEIDLSLLESSPFSDEHKFLENLKFESDKDKNMNIEKSEEKTKNSIYKTLINNIERSNQEINENYLKKFLSPFLNNLKEEELIQLNEDLISNPHMLSSSINALSNSRIFNNDDLQKYETHSGYGVIQFPCKYEAQKAIYCLKEYSDTDCEMILLNDLHLHEIDPQFIAKKLRDTMNYEYDADNIMNKMAKELKKNIKTLQRREYIQKGNGSEALAKDFVDFRYGQEHSSLSSFKNNELKASKRILAEKKNTIQDREDIRNSFREFFEKIHYLHAKNDESFQYNENIFRKVSHKILGKAQNLDFNKSEEIKHYREFKKYLDKVKNKNENYMDDIIEANDMMKNITREELNKINNYLSKYNPDDLKEELDVVLSEFGIEELKKSSLEDMFIDKENLEDYLEARIDSSISLENQQKIKTRAFDGSKRLLNAVAFRNFSTSFEQLKKNFIAELSEGYSSPYEKSLKQLEKNLTRIYYGKILEDNEIQRYVRNYSEIAYNNELNEEKNYFHILDSNSQPFLPFKIRNKIRKELYSQMDMIKMNMEKIIKEETILILNEKEPQEFKKNRKITKKIDEFRLRDGVAVGLMKVKDEVISTKEELDEMVKILNWSNSEYEYVPYYDETGLLYLVKKTKGFRFNIPKLLKYREEKEKLLHELSLNRDFSVEDYLRFEKGMALSSDKNYEKINNYFNNDEQFVSALSRLKNEYYKEGELEELENLPLEIIEQEILDYKDHIIFKKRFAKLTLNDLVKVRTGESVISSIDKENKFVDYDLIIEN